MDEIQQAILEMGITKPTPIQALAIEPVLKGKDVIAKAETGTGKTLAFGAPMMSKIEAGRSTVLGLVMSPTRELAEQVHKVLQTLGEARGLKTALIVGGEPLGPQVKALQAGAQVVVGTPGRVLDLLNQKFLQFPWTEFAILDEADKMLEIGFIDDIKKILDACNEYRQTLLFSATFPPALLDLARGYTNDPVEIATASGVATVDTINQYVLRCGQEDFPRGLAQLIESSAEKDVFLVFCERRTDVDQLMRTLERKRFSVKALHGGYDQAARFRVMTAFRTGDVKCLVATDVASRGLDVAHVTHVINLGLPREFSDYTHRIGRTGRAGRHGAAVTFISGKNERDFEGLLKHTGFDIEELERPRDLFIKERKRQLEREAKSDVEVIDVEGGEVEREERSPRKPREERAERTERKPREERPERAERKPREDRAERAERAPREERPERTERKPREDRAERAERKPREERPERAERKPRRERAERTETSERPERTEQAEKPERKERPERPRRRERSEQDDRPAREESSERPERRPRRAKSAEREVEVEPDVEIEVEAAQEERPRRERSPRRSRSAESSPAPSDEPADSIPAESPRARSRSAESAGTEPDSEEARPRRPRRRRTRSSEDEPRKEAPSRALANAERSTPTRDEAEPEAESQPRATRRRSHEEAEEEAERSRGGRRPRRSRSEPASESTSETPSETRGESPVKPEARRPRRSERTASSESDRNADQKSHGESTGKERSERPKRGRRSDTVREDKDVRPARPAKQGGFGSGV